MTEQNLTLVSHPLCPFVQRAAIVLLEKGVAFDRVNIDLSAKPDWFLALSPTGKVPVLKVRQLSGKDAILFESVVICEYLNETQGGAAMYPDDALLRARHRAWIEFATQTFTEGWQFLHAKDMATADVRRAAFRDRLSKIEAELGDGPYFGGAEFGLVDAVYAPLFRYFGILNRQLVDPIFAGLPRVTAWRVALAERSSVKDAVIDTYPDLFRHHLRQHGALIAAQQPESQELIA
ncbi:glutathione S-transferase family protein [Rhizobium sp. CG4]|jgi:glutathione S-transferase|uniref:glutathione S-transferase family protein n=1 Tax=Rhizobium sp. CG4 TaxID=2726075 RepID=UPI00203474A8|nr:glutathione S-transferase family protein [Rhizobium sp. CG4]MCM2458580.1 glutathione S-transferase family protein [Rhizobium sp. CG4]